MPELPHLHPGQVPAFITSDDELRRWRLCAGITLLICERFDPGFCRELFFGDLPTDPVQPEPTQLVLS
jgi:hypothetical protein